MEYLIGFFTITSLGWLVGCAIGFVAVFIIGDLIHRAGEKEVPVILHSTSAGVHLLISVIAGCSYAQYSPWISALFIVLHLLLVRHWAIRNMNRKEE